MTAPILSTYSNGVGVVSGDQLDTFVQGGALLANLRAFTGLSGMTAWMVGTATPNDGGQGMFYWNAAATAADDGGISTIMPYGVTDGAWIRQSGSAAQIQSVPNIAALRALTSNATPVWVQGYYAPGDGGEGMFNSGTTGTDNGGTTIVTSLGTTYYRETEGDPYSVKWFGAAGITASVDTLAFQAALNTLGAAGGTVVMPAGISYLINSITIPPGVTLKGPFSEIGAPGASNFSPPYGALSSLRMTAGNTITLSGGGCIDGVFLAPSGMTFPQTTAANFAGTAITAAGDDVTLKNSMIFGFALAFTATNWGRVRIRNCNMDNLSCIYINNSEDVCHLDAIHCWPFATIQQGGLAVNLQRSGTAYEMVNCVDDTKIIGCFSYGYDVGFDISGCDDVQLIGCTADNTQTGFGIGFEIVGSSTETVLIACQASAQIIGFYLTESVVSNTAPTFLDGCTAWGNTTHGMLIDTAALGDVTIRGGMVSQSPNGITIGSATPRVDIDGVRFEGITAANPINLTVPSTNVRVGPLCNFGSAVAGAAAASSNMQMPQVAAATVVALPPNNNTFIVTGTTSIGTLEGGWSTRQVTLVFASAITVLTSTGSTNAMRLANGANYATSGLGTLTLLHDGTQWFEIGRAV